MSKFYSTISRLDEMRYKILTNGTFTYEKTTDFLTQWKDSKENILQQTSGSTGRPKLIAIPKWKMIASAKMTGEFFNLSDCKTALLCINPDFIGGKMMIVRSILYDLELIIAPISSNPIKYLDRKIDFGAMVPMQVEQVLKENPEKLKLIENLIIGGAPVSQSLEEKLVAFNRNAFATFGMTETVSHIALKKLSKKNQPYKAIGNTTFLTHNENQLVISNSDLQINELITNDCVNLLDGKSFHWLGRKDFVINSGGIKLHPEKIEKKIASLFNETPFFIAGIKDDMLGEKLVLVIEESAKNIFLNINFQAYLSAYEIPKQTFFVDKISRNSNGKIDRRKTLKQFSFD